MKELMGQIKLILLDRDGVLNVDRPDSVKNIEEFKMIPQAAQAVALLNGKNIPVVLVTNQSVIAKGLTSEKELHDIHDHLNTLLENENAHLDDIFYCPFYPKEKAKFHFPKESSRRKPEPGMLIEAMEKYKVKPSETIMVGDSLTDLEAAHKAQCHKALVLTGKGKSVVQKGIPEHLKPASIFDHIYEFAQQV